MTGPILAIDTALAQCAVAVVGQGVRHVIAEPMTKGHAERLPLMAREALQAVGVEAGELARVVVVTGPGSFTGVRVGIAFARGLCIGTAAQAVGVSSLEALAATAGAASEAEATAVVIDARRGEVFFQVFENGEELSEPAVATLEAASTRIAALADGRAVRLVGSGADLAAPMLASAGLAAIRSGPNVIDVVALAAHGAALATTPDGPRALYIRSPDATLPPPSPFAPQ